MRELKSNALRQALAGSGADSPHPDAEVLTAFREGALLPREREGVLKHLALCADCREVLGVAAAVEQQSALVLAMPVRRPASRVLAPWLAAAAVLLAVSGIVVREEMRRGTQAPAVAVKETPPTPAIEAAQANGRTKPAAKQAKKTPESRSKAAPVRRQGMALAPAPEQASARFATESPTTEANALQHAEVAPQPEPQPGLARIAPRPATPMAAAEAPAATGAMDQGTVSANSAAPSAPASRAVVTAGAAMAKPLAVTPELSIAPARWRINAKGELERAFGNGPWVRVPLPAGGRMHAIAIEGAEVWTGGEHAELFRSNDNGATWTPVSLPVKGTGAPAIAHIRLGAAGEITVVAADGTTWRSEDGGTTWK